MIEGRLISASNTPSAFRLVKKETKNMWSSNTLISVSAGTDFFYRSRVRKFNRRECKANLKNINICSPIIQKRQEVEMSNSTKNILNIQISLLSFYLKCLTKKFSIIKRRRERYKKKSHIKK